MMKTISSNVVVDRSLKMRPDIRQRLAESPLKRLFSIGDGMVSYRGTWNRGKPNVFQTSSLARIAASFYDGSVRTQHVLFQ